MAESGPAETGDVQAAAQGCGCGGALDGHLAGGGLQGGAEREGVCVGGAFAGVQRDEAGESEPAGEEGGGGVAPAGEGWAVDVRVGQ